MQVLQRRWHAGRAGAILDAMAPDLLSPDDERILALETGVIAGHTCKVIELAGERPPTLDELREHVAERLDREPRLRCRLEPGTTSRSRAAWVADDDFDVARHVVAPAS